MMGLNPMYGILFFAIFTGCYTIYGGLKSAAWTDFMQMWVLLVGGLMVPVLGLWKIGGLHKLIIEHPDKFQVFLPPTHERFPFTGVFTGFLSVGIWYSCTSQHIVQRVLGAKDEWNARIGVILAGFLHILTPFFFALPGIIAIVLFPELGKTPGTRPDQAYLLLVQELIPVGLRGLILAAIAAALMSHLSTVLNSASTLVTMDFYKKVQPQSTERQQVVFGQIAGSLLLLLGVVFAVYYAMHPEQPLFVRIQNVFFWLAPPFAVIFTLGLLWKRANATAALWTIALGFAFTGFLQWWFDHNKWILKYFSDTYQHRALFAWIFSMAVMIIVSLLTAPPPLEKTEGIIWSKKYARLPADEAAKYTGLRDYRLWWALFVGSVLVIYLVFLVFRLRHPW
jgi:SSS family solute:Na+ symporter